LDEIASFRGKWGNIAHVTKIDDPFKMVEEDLARTKEFALNNIVISLMLILV
jgi:hypothetical protein